MYVSTAPEQNYIPPLIGVTGANRETEVMYFPVAPEQNYIFPVTGETEDTTNEMCILLRAIYPVGP